MDDLKSEVPELYWHAPISGEQYAFPDDAYGRLQNYALVTGFAIVMGSGSEKKGRIEYLAKSRAKDCKLLSFIQKG